jgi:serine/threonine protein kinase/formylglycine-generating enzyme required for sulfatase activity
LEIEPHRKIRFNFSMIGFGRYNLILRLGQGGMGSVYLARQKSLRRFCAIKLINPQLLQNSRIAERFLREARTAAALSHPNLVAIYDYDQFEGRYFIVMEYVGGFSLRQILRHNGAVPLPLAFHWLKQVAVGLECVHSMNIVHRDIKPDNFIVDAHNVLRIMDLGVAKSHLATEFTLTGTGALLGSPHFMSPEQIHDSRDVDCRTDLYSLGITFYQMLTGKMPFDSPSVAAIYVAHIQVPMPSVCFADEELTRALDGLIASLTAKERGSRLASATALIEAVDPWLASYPLDETCQRYLKRLEFEEQTVESLLKKAQADLKDVDADLPVDPSFTTPARDPFEEPGTFGSLDSGATLPVPVLPTVSRRRPRRVRWALAALAVLVLALVGALLIQQKWLPSPGQKQSPPPVVQKQPGVKPSQKPTEKPASRPVMPAPEPPKAEPKEVKVEVHGPPMLVDLDGRVKLEMVKIEAGSFRMGSEKGSPRLTVSQSPVHAVTITHPFYIGRYEVTQEQWLAVVGDNPSRFKDGEDAVKRPVECVSWNDINERFLPRVATRMPKGWVARLPTEAEWEYCSRAGSSTEYCFGDDPGEILDYAWGYENSGNATHPVGQKKPNAWGLYDMYGNVLEWCQDICGPYPAESVTDPLGPTTGSDRAHRGGAWKIYSRYCSSPMRNRMDPRGQCEYVGFRLAASLSP